MTEVVPRGGKARRTMPKEGRVIAPNPMRDGRSLISLYRETEKKRLTVRHQCHGVESGEELLFVVKGQGDKSPSPRSLHVPRWHTSDAPFSMDQIAFPSQPPAVLSPSTPSRFVQTLCYSVC